MEILLYTTSGSDKDNSVVVNYIKTININFLPVLGYHYIDSDSKKAYTVKSVLFSNDKTVVLLTPESDDRFKEFSQILSAN